MSWRTEKRKIDYTKLKKLHFKEHDVLVAVKGDGEYYHVEFICKEGNGWEPYVPEGHNKAARYASHKGVRAEPLTSRDIAEIRLSVGDF